MTKDYLELREIIEELISDIDSVKKIWCSIRKDNPDFEQVSEKNWESKEALLWMHGATKTWEAVELEKWLFPPPELSEIAKSEAIDNYLAWCDHIEEDGDYTEFGVNDLPKPQNDESLIDYIIRLSQIIEGKGWGTKGEKRALKSFLHFLREDYHQEVVAFIEHIFPQKIDLRGGRIIRKIQQQVYPIPQQLVGAIIKELAHQCAYGRLNARHNAAEALALSWLCLTASRLRLPISLEKGIHKTKSSAILLNGESPELLVPTYFGGRKIRISNQVAKFLCAIANIAPFPRKTILQSATHDLRRALNTAITAVNPTPGLGKITFLTFLSTPHLAGENIR